MIQAILFVAYKLLMKIGQRIGRFIMGEFVKGLRNKLVGVLADAADSKIDGYTIGLGLDKQMDEKLQSDKTSEKIQRGVMTNTFLEVCHGLWAEDEKAWADRLEEEAKVLRKKIGGNA